MRRQEYYSFDPIEMVFGRAEGILKNAANCDATFKFLPKSRVNVQVSIPVKSKDFLKDSESLLAVKGTEMVNQLTYKMFLLRFWKEEVRKR